MKRMLKTDGATTNVRQTSCINVEQTDGGNVGQTSGTNVELGRSSSNPTFDNVREHVSSGKSLM